MSTEWGIVLSSTQINEKSNEIPEMQKVIKQIDCRGCIVTADAMNTQKETARAIITNAQGDYCLALKENQKTAYYEVKDYFASKDILKEIMLKDGCCLKETELAACGMITREYFITDDTGWFEDKMPGRSSHPSALKEKQQLKKIPVKSARKNVIFCAA